MKKIAIIGISSRFHSSNNKDAFWDNLSKSVNHLTITNGQSPDKNKKGNFNQKNEGPLLRINNKYSFDADFFRITDKEAKYVDPHHRIFLEEAFSAMEDSGYDFIMDSGLFYIIVD